MDLRCAVLTLAAVCSMSTVQAQSPGLVAYEGFSNGPLTDLNGSAGGTGWAGPWVDAGSSQLTSVGGQGLAYPHLRTSPGAAETPAGGSFDAASYTRGWTTPPAPGDHVFISFLLRPGAGAGTYGGVSFGGYTMIGVPLTMNTYSMRLGRYLFVDSGVPAVPGQTALLVLEMTFANSTTAYRLYVNPDLTQGKPATASAQYTLGGNAIPQALSLMNDGDYTTDEIRVATDWNDCVPPPTTVCFGLTGPLATTVCGGGTAELLVVPSGSPGPFEYRWYRGLTLLADGPSGLGSMIGGAQTGRLRITGATAADGGFYTCVVQDACGPVTSAPAALAVCMADFNCSGAVSVQDIFDFLGGYFAGDARADVNRSGSVSVQDIFDFLAGYFAGC